MDIQGKDQNGWKCTNVQSKANSYKQRPNVDFKETFIFVAILKSIRILLAMVAYPDNGTRQKDVKNYIL